MLEKNKKKKNGNARWQIKTPWLTHRRVSATAAGAGIAAGGAAVASSRPGQNLNLESAAEGQGVLAQGGSG